MKDPKSYLDPISFSSFNNALNLIYEQINGNAIWLLWLWMWIAECRCNDIKRGWEILTPVVCPVWYLISLYNAWIRYKIIIELFFYKIQYNNFTKTIKLLLVIRSLETLWKEVYSDSSRLDDVHVSSQHCVDDSPTFTQLTDSGA